MKIPPDAFKFLYVHLVIIKYAYEAKNLKGLPVRQWLWSGPQMSSQLFIWHFWYKTEEQVNSFSPSVRLVTENFVLFFQNTSSLLEARESIRPLMEPAVMFGLRLSLLCQIENAGNCPSVARRQYPFSLVARGENALFLLNSLGLC